MFLTVRDAAKLFRVSEKTIYRWIAAGTVPHTRAGDQYRFSRSELLSWAAASGKHIASEAICEPEGVNEPLPTVREAMEEGGIFYRVGGTTPEEVLREIASVMHIPSGLERDYVFKALLARESLASTAIGDGVAIPHMRHPLLLVEKPSLTLCFLAEPVEWGAVDSLPVEIAFVPCCPSLRTHLHVLSRVSFLLKQPQVRHLLARKSLRSEILRTLTETEQCLA